MRSHFAAVDPYTLAEIQEIIAATPFTTIHYVGCADESVIRALKERYSLSIMDQYNRTNRSTHFWFDETELDFCQYPIPDWMDGVVSYEEGASPHEIALRDIPWNSADQLDRIVAFAVRSAPELVILFGEADLLTTCQSYEWERRTGISIGRRKQADQPS
jgi:hypothetical protein